MSDTGEKPPGTAGNRTPLGREGGELTGEKGEKAESLAWLDSWMHLSLKPLQVSLQQQSFLFYFFLALLVLFLLNQLNSVQLKVLSEILNAVRSR